MPSLGFKVHIARRDEGNIAFRSAPTSRRRGRRRNAGRGDWGVHRCGGGIAPPKATSGGVGCRLRQTFGDERGVLVRGGLGDGPGRAGCLRGVGSGGGGGMPWCNGAMYRVHDEQTVRRVVTCRGVMAQCTG